MQLTFGIFRGDWSMAPWRATCRQRISGGALGRNLPDLLTRTPTYFKAEPRLFRGWYIAWTRMC